MNKNYFENVGSITHLQLLVELFDLYTLLGRECECMENFLENTLVGVY